MHPRRAHVVHAARERDRPALRVHRRILHESPEAEPPELRTHDLVQPAESALIARVDAPIDPDARHTEGVAPLAERHAARRVGRRLDHGFQRQPRTRAHHFDHLASERASHGGQSDGDVDQVPSH